MIKSAVPHVPVSSLTSSTVFVADVLEGIGVIQKTKKNHIQWADNHADIDREKIASVETEVCFFFRLNRFNAPRAAAPRQN